MPNNPPAAKVASRGVSRPVACTVPLCWTGVMAGLKTEILILSERAGLPAHLDRGVEAQDTGP